LEEARVQREQIEVVAVGLGPGSYSGIRAAIALAQGGQLAVDVKLAGISSAACVARQASETGLTGQVNVIIDAQRGEFYLACYELTSGTCRETEALRIVSRSEIEARERAGELLAGPDVTRWFGSGRVLFPSAALLARMASEREEFISGERMEPIYLREVQFVKAPPGRIVP
jgi:tRNA threonylcarbamoyladenosine biosynthesis protein TsaB